MDQIDGMIQHTPIWVFVVFAVLLFLGVQASRPRTVLLPRVLITPAVFIVWGIVSLVTRPNFSALLVGDWIVAALIGAGIAALLVRFPALQADRAHRRVHLPGSPWPLIRNIVIFAAKYGLAAAAAMTPAARDHLAIWDIAVSGLSAGYFLGWLGRFAAAYRRAPALTMPLPSSALQGGAS